MWNYRRVKAPEDYPGKTYNSGLCLEHHFVWWKNTGDIVPSGFVIHHKDGNSRNNAFDNLEIISLSEHTRKHRTTGKTMIDLICPVCNSEFTREKRQTHLVKTENDSTCCSRKCSAIKSHWGSSSN